MAEAEGVLLEAAERALAATRALWARGRPAAAGPPALELADLRGPLAVLIEACLGVEAPLVATDPAPAPGRLARGLGRLPPWRLAPAAPAFTDGERIFLPRRLPLSEDSHALLRATALGLARRIVRGAPRCCPEAPLARDVFWLVEGAAGDRWLEAELPGLAPALRRLREAALAARPDPRALTPSERRVEALARGFLRGALAAPGSALPATALARFAERWAAREPEGAAYRGVAPVPHWGVARPDLAAEVASASSGAAAAAAREARRAAPGRRLERRIESRREEPEEDAAAPPILLASEDGHLAVQDPAGLRRPRDRDTDEPLDLDALADELARLPELARVREPGAVGEILESDDEARGAAPAAADCADAAAMVVGILYPEWDHRAAAYRAGHCVVRETVAPEGDPQWAGAVRRAHAALFARVRRVFEALRPRRERRRRQIDGDDLDLDAIVADHADRRAHLPGSDRIYTEQRPNRRDVAVSFLVDASGSTDAHVADARSVLEIEQAATLALCEALRRLGDRHAVHAFSGEGRRDVRVMRIKGFDEDPGVAPGRIAGLAPDRFTRLGAPLRHLTAALAREPARRRLLLLLSDGKPNDEDEYEGRYGVEDVRQAVLEARALGLEVFCLTVDREGSRYLPRMFGPSGYAVLADVRQLPERLLDLYRRLTAAGP